MRPAFHLRSRPPRQVHMQFPHPPNGGLQCDPKDEGPAQNFGRAGVRKHLPNHRCEGGESERAHGGATGIQAHCEAASDCHRNTGFKSPPMVGPKALVISPATTEMRPPRRNRVKCSYHLTCRSAAKLIRIFTGSR